MRNVCIEARLKLEATLLSRWGRRHSDEVLRALVPWSGWRWPTENEISEAIPYLAKSARARRLREAKAQLVLMRSLPPVTPPEDVALLQLQINFGLLPRSAIVLPEDRQLTPFAALAIIARGLPMTMAVAKIIGGCHLVPLAVLQAELDRRTDAQVDRLAELEQRAPRSSGGGHGGLSVLSFTF